MAQDEKVSTYLEDEQLKLRDLNSLYDFEIVADGEKIGTVRDFFLDDIEWAVRFISLGDPERIPDKKVLISPLALGDIEWGEQKFPIGLRHAKLEKNATLGADEPVSRLFELGLYKKLNWTPYWIESEYHETPPPPAKADTGLPRGAEDKQDPDLYSARELVEFRLAALDGDAGQVVDFIIDEEDWIVYYLVVEIGGDLNARRVLISTDWIERVGRDEGVVYSDLSKDVVRSAPEFDPAAPITRDVELDLYDYYGRPHYWVEEDVIEDRDDVGQGTQGE